MAPTTPGSNRALEDLDDQVSDPPAPALAPRRIIAMGNLFRPNDDAPASPSLPRIPYAVG